ncbi:hypothetical protein J3E68DRAFT_391945 [Trichoderma sp. SZMC 28012]
MATVFTIFLMLQRFVGVSLFCRLASVAISYQRRRKTVLLFIMFRYGAINNNNNKGSSPYSMLRPYISSSSIGSPISSPSGYVSTRRVVVCISCRYSRPKTF